MLLYTNNFLDHKFLDVGYDPKGTKLMSLLCTVHILGSWDTEDLPTTWNSIVRLKVGAFMKHALNYILISKHALNYILISRVRTCKINVIDGLANNLSVLYIWGEQFWHFQLQILNNNKNNMLSPTKWCYIKHNIS